jgi:flagellar hook-length control protein FliK
MAHAGTPRAEAAAPEISPQIAQQVSAQVVGRLAGRLGGFGGKGALRMTLTPPELGRVEIRFTREGARLQLFFRVESAVAARALQDGSGHLQELLMGSNPNWQQIEISIEREGEGAKERAPSDQRERSRRDGEGEDAPDRHEQEGET